jgi:hypothetical protein
MLITNLVAAGDPLVEVQREAQHGLAFAQKARFGYIIDIIATQLEFARTLRGLTPTFGSFDDEGFDELGMEGHFSSNSHLVFAECWLRNPLNGTQFRRIFYKFHEDAESDAHERLE